MHCRLCLCRLRYDNVSACVLLLASLPTIFVIVVPPLPTLSFVPVLLIAPRMASNSSSKKNKGRHKIEMKKMMKESNLQVTFSKRRGGLFKKASELSTLCGVELALIVFSPGNKAYSFGHPSVEALIKSFTEGGGPPHLDAATVHFTTEAHDELNTLLAKINEEIEAERKQLQEMNRWRKEAEAKWWWAAPVGEMSVPKLKQYKVALEKLKKTVTCHFEKLRINKDPVTVGNYTPNNMMRLPVHVPMQVSLPIFFSSLFQNSQMHNHHQAFQDEIPYHQFYSYTAMLQQGGGSSFEPYTRHN
ncbi:agamous-like MADS-box protein AGL61 [Arachis duranensis]|uniref:Agamous-like MADS-box protein AGL61 n=2 Tax=Arachis TaxID=3817 RepID=A0A6P5NMX6_ARADU|nr:agamous-like MADS-box protein AGL61 [Arachis duranensis]